ncbi:unnamed protein product [Allacma fusca]|uniref:Origin recognition complex subunit 4 n=1 Tax=Allacma fusca TaxID=39272 RepID=A0A8J2PHM1_9HEXA|nr:unnamed protein product [Allacma fusca]
MNGILFTDCMGYNPHPRPYSLAVLIVNFPEIKKNRSSCFGSYKILIMSVINDLVEKLNPSVRFQWPRTQYNLDSQSEHLKKKLLNLVEARESFNMIIMGPPGCGKSTFFESCLANLKTHKEFYYHRRIIRLNGLVCGKQLKAAVDEIFRQLKIEDEFDKRVTYDDMKPREHEDCRNRLDSVMDLLRLKINESGASKKSRIYIFLLDHLEYFCEGTQLLLYNLFDACLNSKGCIGVVGITSRIDITEMFEKRVKSRFSHRIINLSGGRTFDDYLTMAGGLMSLDQSRNIGNWNEEMLLIMKSPQTQKILRMLYETDKSVGRLSLFLYEVALASDDSTQIQENIVKTWNRFNTSSKVQQILDLPVFDLMLILAIRNVHSNPFQFETLWQQIHKLASQFKLERSDLKHALENLEVDELIVPIKTRGAGKVRKRDETGFYRSNISYNDMTTALKTYPQMPSSYQEYIIG